MATKVVVEGKEYQLDQETKNVMELFKEAEALEKLNANQPYEISQPEVLDENSWTEVLRLCKVVSNKFPEVAKVKTS